ncbi:MAG: ATP-binding cassette domain-containing protein [Gemmataceae bacterium]|nr:ATP-binding cassette domain-containing protein [Gemmataceae bacterium]
MVEVDHLTKSFPDVGRGPVVAVDGISFAAQPGEIFGLLGPNGAGKTTALRILSTLLRPTTGTARVAGFDVSTQPNEVRRRIGFMSASTGVYDRMSAWELVEFFGRLGGMAADRLKPRMEEVFTLLQMNDFRDVMGGSMSTGMKQKVSFARAIIHDPPVLIFDEPTAGLDVLVARTVLQTIQQFRTSGKCILFSTHIMREVEKLCDRVAILHRGRILTSGTLLELREKHAEHDLEELFFSLVS